MSESTDEALSHACEHCGKRFYRRRHVNQHTRIDSLLDSKIVRTKFCSVECRRNAYRVRQGKSASVPAAAGPDVPVASVRASSPPPPVSAPPFKTDPWSEFERMRGDRVLSRWVPIANPNPNGLGFDIPEFLRRT